MSNEEILRHLFACLVFSHKYDKSCQITKEAQAKENLMFESSVGYLRTLDKEHKVFNELKLPTIDIHLEASLYQANGN